MTLYLFRISRHFSLRRSSQENNNKTLKLVVVVGPELLVNKKIDSDVILDECYLSLALRFFSFDSAFK